MTAVAQQVADSGAVQPRRIVARTKGRRNGPAVRLMSPSDFGQLLKPFVFLDFFDMQGPPFVGALHPHSGIATLSYLIDGRMDLIDPDGRTVVLPSGGVEWMQAGRGMWHGGSVGDRTRGACAASSYGWHCRLRWNLARRWPLSSRPSRSSAQGPHACCWATTAVLAAPSKLPRR